MKKLFWVLLIGLFMMVGQWASQGNLLAQDDDNCVENHLLDDNDSVLAFSTCTQLPSAGVYLLPTYMNDAGEYVTAPEGASYVWSVLKGSELVEIVTPDERCALVIPSDLQRSGIIVIEVQVIGSSGQVLGTAQYCLLRGEVDWLREYPG